MNDAGWKLRKSKAIITSACAMLDHSHHPATRFTHEFQGSGADCYVLLHDASQLYCDALSEMLGQPDKRRWSPVLPELLLSHPERCEETLALVEQPEGCGLSHLQYVAV